MIYYNDRLAISSKYREWANENSVDNTPSSFLGWLLLNDLIDTKNMETMLQRIRRENHGKSETV